MTPKSVIEIDFEEIDAIELKCARPGCGGAVTIPVRKDNIPLLLSCPGCNENWWNNGKGSLFDKVTNLSRAIMEWQRREEKPFMIGVTMPFTAVP